MTDPQADERCPVTDEAPPTTTATRSSQHSTAPAALGYVIEVTTTDPDPRHRRRVYLSLHSATKALERAARRGHDARLTLCELVPVEGVGA